MRATRPRPSAIHSKRFVLGALVVLAACATGAERPPSPPSNLAPAENLEPVRRTRVKLRTVVDAYLVSLIRWDTKFRGTIFWSASFDPSDGEPIGSVIWARLVTDGEPLDPSNLLLDSWGHAIRFESPGPVHTKGWDLYSFGPNGIDEHGRGDDVVVGEDFSDEARGALTRHLLDTKVVFIRWFVTHMGYLDADMWHTPDGGPVEYRADRVSMQWSGPPPTPPLDAWGHVFRLQAPGPVHTRGWDLWSVGPNGVDEQGGGDDILVGEDIAEVTTRE